MVWIEIIGRGHSILQPLCFNQHDAEPHRPGQFVHLFKISEFTHQMNRAQLMFSCRSFKMSLPAIMNQHRFLRDFFGMFINRAHSPVGRGGNIRGQFTLPGPEPVFLPVDVHSSFIGSDNRTFHDLLPDHLIRRNALVGQTVQQAVNASFADRHSEDVTYQLMQSPEGEVMPDAEITDKALQHPSIAYLPGNIQRKITVKHMAACATILVYPVFSDHLFDNRDVDNLANLKDLRWQSAGIPTTLRTKTTMVFDNLIRLTAHLKRFAFMTRLPANLPLRLFPQTIGSFRTVLIFGRRYRTIMAILTRCIPGHLLFQRLNPQLQLLVLFNKQCDNLLLAIDDYLLRCLHNEVLHKSTPAIPSFQRTQSFIYQSLRTTFVNNPDFLPQTQQRSLGPCSLL